MARKLNELQKEVIKEYLSFRNKYRPFTFKDEIKLIDSKASVNSTYFMMCERVLEKGTYDNNERKSFNEHVVPVVKYNSEILNKSR